MSEPLEPTVSTRRSVLQAVGLAALTGGGVGVLGACSAGGDTGPPVSSAPATSPSGAESPSTPVATPSGPRIAVRDVPVGGGVVLNEADYVITQPTAGEFRAFDKFCTHRKCPIASVGGGRINCMCHRSGFSISDGSVQGGPATRPLPSTEVTVAGGFVIVTG